MSTADDRFEERLRATTGEADAVPQSVIDDAKALFALRDLDAELAELVADSFVDEPAVLTRALVADVRMLTFACDGLTVELDVDTDPTNGRVTVVGLVTGDVEKLVLVLVSGRTPVDLDVDGRFRFTMPGGGPIRLELTAPGDRRVSTVWVTV